MSRQNIASGTKWEAFAGYSRAVRIGNWVSVAGTTAVDDRSEPVGVNDPHAQTRYILAKIERALKQAGASLNDVIRTRIYIVDERRWEEVARAHGEVFETIRPANSLIVIKALVDPRLLVEIEADALIEDNSMATNR
ncbi:MAG TPA: RidA family protein [Aggregatilineales bacterium]|nr:RidA family protein [Aggregatilineales bacterium]